MKLFKSLIDLNGWITALLISLAWLNFAENLWTDAGAGVSLTSPALDRSRQRVDPWSRYAIVGNKNSSLISFMQFPIINSMTPGPVSVRRLSAILLQSSRAVSWPDQRAADDSAPSPWSLSGESSTPRLQPVQRVSPAGPWLEDRGRSLLRRSQWGKKENWKYILFHKWCLDHFDASLAIQSDLHNKHRW